MNANEVSRYAVTRALARRARLIHDGAERLVATNSKNPCRVALEEYKAGKLAGITVLHNSSSARE